MLVHREYYRDPSTGETGCFEWSDDPDAGRDEDTGMLHKRNTVDDPESRDHESLLPKLPGSGLVRRSPEWAELWSDSGEATSGVAAFEEKLRKSRR